MSKMISEINTWSRKSKIFRLGLCSNITYTRALQTGGPDPPVGRERAQWGSRDFRF